MLRFMIKLPFRIIAAPVWLVLAAVNIVLVFLVGLSAGFCYLIAGISVVTEVLSIGFGISTDWTMKSGMDILKELEEFYMLEKETEKSEARKVAVLMKGYLQSMKSNIREIIRYIDDTTLEKSNDKKKDKQESASTISEEVQEFVNLTITEHMGKAYSEWKLKQDKEPVSEIDKKYQKLLETLSQEQEEVITEYCNAIFSSGAETEEFFYRMGLKDGLNLKNTVKSVLEMIS